MNRMLSVSLVIGTMACLVLSGCGDGYDTEEAEATCDAIKQADDYNCMSAADYSDCVACHEDCGDGCLVVDTSCPPSFSCSD